MCPLHSSVLKRFPQTRPVPRKPLSNLYAPDSGLPRGARKSERQLRPRQPRTGRVRIRGVAVLDRAFDFLPLQVPREVREVPCIVPGVVARVVVIHDLLEVRDAAHVVDDLEAAADALRQRGSLCSLACSRSFLSLGVRVAELVGMARITRWLWTGRPEVLHGPADGGSQMNV